MNAPKPLTQAMRDALVSRTRVKFSTAQALARRGLAIPTKQAGILGGYDLVLTPAGQDARDAELDRFKPGMLVRNTLNGTVFRVVRVDRNAWYDCLILVRPGMAYADETAGTPTYNEPVDDPQAEYRTDDAADAQDQRDDALLNPSTPAVEDPITDEMVAAAINAYVGTHPDVTTADAMRAALRAALAVGLREAMAEEAGSTPRAVRNGLADYWPMLTKETKSTKGVILDYCESREA